MRALLHRLRREQACWEELRMRVRGNLPELARVLREEFGASRVWLFGSMLRDSPSPQPDIDLLVEGIAASRLGEALGRMFLLAPLPVDLVPLETGRPEIVQRALEEGELLIGP